MQARNIAAALVRKPHHQRHQTRQEINKEIENLGLSKRLTIALFYTPAGGERM
ncbi:hypothetical protein B0G76_5669 [Paraburkholderia sp. BL23I1N1]|nr:hypothetical protein B0G76_5669 [Paraburkholderia sp. BL23I1N1]